MPIFGAYMSLSLGAGHFQYVSVEPTTIKVWINPAAMRVKFNNNMIYQSQYFNPALLAFPKIITI